MRAPKARAKNLGHYTEEKHMTSSFSTSKMGHSPPLAPPCWRPCFECSCLSAMKQRWRDIYHFCKKIPQKHCTHTSSNIVKKMVVKTLITSFTQSAHRKMICFYARRVPTLIRPLVNTLAGAWLCACVVCTGVADIRRLLSTHNMQSIMQIMQIMQNEKSS